MTALIAVALLGGLGAATRFVVDGAIRSRWTHVLPVATIVVNVSGSLAIGLVAGAASFHGLPPDWRLAAATGFCGGYTTFSTAMVETVRLAQAGELRHATVNVLGTLVLTCGAAALGVAVMAALA
ncbi:MAG TPA: fluoride efflux transporter CrcB [Actinotalea sp.]|nr:fluoride efflux transporter CrcB [Actinotalea sp.]